MRILIAFSGDLLGYDPVITAIMDEFRTVDSFHQLDVVDVCRPVEQLMPVLTKDHDMVILMNATAWYLKNRLALSGRFKTFLFSFCMEDFLALLQTQTSPQDLMLHGIFTNGEVFMKNVSAAIPARFQWKPCATVDLSNRLESELVLGTVLPNVLDRDFSQLVLTIEALTPETANKFKIFLAADEKMRLPGALEPFAVRVPRETLFTCYTLFTHFIPAPRITDYRVGILPAEYMQAIISGCRPMLFHHPLTIGLESIVRPIFRSLVSYEKAVLDVLEGVDPIKVEHANYGDGNFLTTPARVVEDLLTIYDRLNANAST